MTINAQNPLPNSLWEKFAQEIKSGHSRTEAYMSTYGITDRTKASRSAWRLMQNEAIKGRVIFLSPLAVKEEVDLKSVIHTCQEVIEGKESTTPQRLKAIEVLNKLGVFDNESKTIQRMDPAALCEYLAQFASHPARELEHIPGGLSGLMKRLMDLTGASKGAMIEALNEATDMKVDVKAPEEVEDKDDDDFPMDEDTQDREILAEVVDAMQDDDGDAISEAMKEKLAPALELAKELEKEDDQGSDKGPGDIFDF